MLTNTRLSDAVALRLGSSMSHIRHMEGDAPFAKRSCIRDRPLPDITTQSPRADTQRSSLRTVRLAGLPANVLANAATKTNRVSTAERLQLLQPRTVLFNHKAMLFVLLEPLLATEQDVDLFMAQ